MLSTSGVPYYFRDHVPWLRDTATEYINSLQEAASYPFMWDAVSKVLLKASAAPPKERDEDLQAFFTCVEDILRDGDHNARDLITIEVIVRISDPLQSGLLRFLGPLTKAKVEKVVQGLSQQRQSP